MNSGDILHNHDTIESLLLSTGRKGIESFVEALEQSDFYNVSLGRPDPGEGSLANLCLWVIRISQDTLAYARESNASIPESMDQSIIIVSVLRNVLQCHFKQFQLTGPAPSRLGTLLRKTGLEILDHEMPVLLSEDEITGASVYSQDASLVLSNIFGSGMKNAFGYSLGIPFTAEPAVYKRPEVIWKSMRTWLNESDHRIWCLVTLPGFESHEHPDMEGFTPVDTSCIIPLSFTENQDETDCAVMCDENGMMAFLAGYSREDDGNRFMSSDRVCYGYVEICLYLSRYPFHRPSYVVARRGDGKWGVFSAKVSSKKRIPLVDVNPLVRFEFRNREAAVRAIKTRAGFPARVSHHLFYEMISVSDCFLGPEAQSE
ncbi:MAG: hypothetical protein MJY86_08545 [Bacteroidales bacterium]|nr:hypothetical protein [Bacteroidales bacterium]